ncbi:trp operon repressor [Ferrimonas lipolytica]|uniref:Trp operon repressor homolog n=1 Tax=Ferrimonas lipolytica TaxID=2724191 RepID=A0A6H1UCL5_9GAMM|nr:trp operon repressor [Ferrimonas lipolytica]QIZ75552.1 trp operon repressor [Ferrimonas lipolytica]
MTEQRWQNVLNLLTEQSSIELIDQILSLLLSHDERQSVSGRLAVIKALLHGELSQRQISAQLGVSIATITRASNNLKTMTDAERDTLAQLLQR